MTSLIRSYQGEECWEGHGHAPLQPGPMPVTPQTVPKGPICGGKEERKNGENTNPVYRGEQAREGGKCPMCSTGSWNAETIVQ